MFPQYPEDYTQGRIYRLVMYLATAMFLGSRLWGQRGHALSPPITVALLA